MLRRDIKTTSVENRCVLKKISYLALIERVYNLYNKILDRDWFSARLFVTQSARDHVGVRFERFHVNNAGFNGYFCNVLDSFNTYEKRYRCFRSKRTSQKTFLIPIFVVDTIN